MLEWNSYSKDAKIAVIGIIIAVIITVIGWFVSPLAEGWVKGETSHVIPKKMPENNISNILETKLNLFLKSKNDHILDSLRSQFSPNCKVERIYKDGTRAEEESYEAYFDFMKVNMANSDSIHIQTVNKDEQDKIKEIILYHYNKN